jgi:hypothetical protein
MKNGSNVIIVAWLPQANLTICIWYPLLQVQQDIWGHYRYNTLYCLLKGHHLYIHCVQTDPAKMFGLVHI